MDGYNASLIERIDITPRLAIIRIRPDIERYDFTAGQYTVLGLAAKALRVAEAEPEETPNENQEKIIKRAYSPCRMNSDSRRMGTICLNQSTSGYPWCPIFMGLGLSRRT